MIITNNKSASRFLGKQNFKQQENPLSIKTESPSKGLLEEQLRHLGVFSRLMTNVKPTPSFGTNQLTFDYTVKNFFPFPNSIDKYQHDAIKGIYDGKDVLVSAPTGTGKTAIAEYAIAKNLNDKKRTFYTTPLKALSNQKYLDFCKNYGKDNVGLLTGDLKINGKAPIVVMTTEIYNNMLKGTNSQERDETFKDVGSLILDECHYMNDDERGTVWEESIMYSPKNLQIVPLSATVGNSSEMAQWIGNIRGKKPIEVDVPSEQRHVPLQYLAFNPSNVENPLKPIFDGDINLKTLKTELESGDIVDRKKEILANIGQMLEGEKSPEVGLEKLESMTEDSVLSQKDCSEKLLDILAVNIIKNKLIDVLPIENQTEKENKAFELAVNIVDDTLLSDVTNKTPGNTNENRREADIRFDRQTNALTEFTHLMGVKEKDRTKQYQMFSNKIMTPLIQKKAFAGLKDQANQAALILTDSKTLKVRAGNTKPMSSKESPIGNLLNQLNKEDKLPAIFFIFSKNKCDSFLSEFGKDPEFSLINEDKSKAILDIVGQLEKKGQYFGVDFNSKESSIYKKALTKGIAVHHAGMLPSYKSLVEELFKNNYILSSPLEKEMQANTLKPEKKAALEELSEVYTGKKDVRKGLQKLKELSGISVISQSNLKNKLMDRLPEEKASHLAKDLTNTKNLLKAVFATETLAAGINLPVKTTVFTSFFKPTGELNEERKQKKRRLNANEMLQMSGRAGRRGIDPIGQVIFLDNKYIDIGRQLATSKSMPIESHLKPNYSFLLNFLRHNPSNKLEQELENSFLYHTLNNFETEKNTSQAVEKKQMVEKNVSVIDLESLQTLRNNKSLSKEKKIALLNLSEYLSGDPSSLKGLKELRNLIDPSQKTIETNELANRLKMCPVFQKDSLKDEPLKIAKALTTDTIIKKVEVQKKEEPSEAIQYKEFKDKETQIDYEKDLVDFKVMQGVLENIGFIEKEQNAQEHTYKLTENGEKASKVRGTNEVFLTLLLDSPVFKNLNPTDLAGAVSTLVSNNHEPYDIDDYMSTMSDLEPDQDLSNVAKEALSKNAQISSEKAKDPLDKAIESIYRLNCFVSNTQDDIKKQLGLKDKDLHNDFFDISGNTSMAPFVKMWAESTAKPSETWEAVLKKIEDHETKLLQQRVLESKALAQERGEKVPNIDVSQLKARYPEGNFVKTIIRTADLLNQVSELTNDPVLKENALKAREMIMKSPVNEGIKDLDALLNDDQVLQSMEDQKTKFLKKPAIKDSHSNATSQPDSMEEYMTELLDLRNKKTSHLSTLKAETQGITEKKHPQKPVIKKLHSKQDPMDHYLTGLIDSTEERFSKLSTLKAETQGNTEKKQAIQQKPKKTHHQDPSNPLIDFNTLKKSLKDLEKLKSKDPKTLSIEEKETLANLKQRETLLQYSGEYLNHQKVTPQESLKSLQSLFNGAQSATPDQIVRKILPYMINYMNFISKAPIPQEMRKPFAYEIANSLTNQQKGK